MLPTQMSPNRSAGNIPLQVMILRLRIERDEDVSAIFAFLGTGETQDRFLYHVH